MSNIEELGALGEKLVHDYFISQGSDVEMSEDKYDMKKDMTIDGSPTEIKTSTVWYKFKSLVISGEHANQLPKCLAAERLIFVMVPAKTDGIYSQRILNSFDFDRISLYEAPPVGERIVKPATTQYGKKRILFPMHQLKLVTSFVDDALVREFQDLNPSKWC